MDFIQSDKTKQFIQEVKDLVDNGLAPSYRDICNKLEWHPNAMSQVIKGKRDVPADVYKKFTEIYKEGHIKKDWRDEKIQMLEEMNQLLKDQLESKKALETGLEELKKQMSEFEGRMNIKLAEYMESAKRRMVQLRTIQRSQAEHRSKLEKIPLEQMVEHTNSIQSEEHDRIFGKNIS